MVAVGDQLEVGGGRFGGERRERFVIRVGVAVADGDEDLPLEGQQGVTVEDRGRRRDQHEPAQAPVRAGRANGRRRTERVAGGVQRTVYGVSEEGERSGEVDVRDRLVSRRLAGARADAAPVEAQAR